MSVLGAGLDTEVMMAFATEGSNTVPDSTASFYNNWVGTIPRVWVLAGLATLFVSNKTVRNTVCGIYAKLHANGRAEAIVKAREAGFGKR